MTEQDWLQALDAAAFAREVLGFTPDARQEELLQMEAPRCLVNCTRQWGKSTVTAVMALHRAVHREESLTLVVSPSARQSRLFLRKVVGFAQKLGIEKRGDGDNPISLVLPNGSRIVGLPSNEDTVRGFSAVSLLVVDEAARVSEEMWDAVLPMVGASNGDVWLLSTPNGKRGFFWQLWSRGGARWTRVCVPASECSRISTDMLDDARKTRGERMFRQEFCCSFEEAEGAAVAESWLAAMERRDTPVLGSRETAAEWTGETRDYFVGLDLGQRRDYTAIAVVERLDVVYPERSRVTWDFRRERYFRLRHLERVPLGVGYMEVAARVGRLMRSGDLAKRSRLAVDASGVGAPVVEMLRRELEGYPLKAVTITGGRNESQDQWGYKAPRRELLERLLLMLERGELRVAWGLAELGEFKDELRNLRVTGEGYEVATERVHDDLVMAVALAVWGAMGDRGIWGTRRLL